MQSRPAGSPSIPRIATLTQAYALLCFALAIGGIAYFDRLTSVLLVLSTFLFVVVTRYSARYMLGDAGQGRFLVWLCLTSSFVFALVAATNLLVFVGAWCGISLSLHQLLQFYPDRPAALLAARKKFLVSRLGDLALLGTLVLTYQTLGTWHFPDMFAAANRLSARPGGAPESIAWMSMLLVFAALLKSAQFPFHSWLPDTMETPTPVSALMHAGVINAGGILVIRLSPLISLSHTAMLTLCVVGGFTAIFASIVMLTQVSIKRCLAFSTVAQMGFMMLECGLGAFHMALIHLVAHSLYKAHAFLSSGGAVRSGAGYTPRSPGLGTVVAAILASFAVILVTARAMRIDPLESLALNLIFSIALAQMIWTFWGRAGHALHRAAALVALGVLPVLYFSLEHAAAFLVQPVDPRTGWIGAWIAGLLIFVSGAQTQLPRLVHSSLGKALYVHARNGFYFNAAANRITDTLWPRNLAKEGN